MLQSDALAAEKAITCKRLAVYGSDDAVPALAELLPDKRLSSWARIALEAIPGQAANDALRQSMEAVEGRLLVGVINSIGVRRDQQSVTALASRLQDNDAQVASAAAVALGHIGNSPATEALENALADSPNAVRSAVAEGCILCAERLFEDGKLDEAARLYDKVREADVPKQRALEAIRGSILARRSEGIPLLVEQLQSDDNDLFGIGCRTALEISGRNLTEAIAAQLDSVPSNRQAIIVRALAEREDDAVLPAILRAVEDGQENVRTVAIEVLGRVGDASCVSTLLDAAVSRDADLSEARRCPGDPSRQGRGPGFGRSPTECQRARRV